MIKAESFLDRAKGLLGSNNLAESSGLWLVPCKSIHTFFMKFTIDVIFINSNSVVLGLYSKLPPYRLTKTFWSAHSAIELPAGVIQHTLTKIGHHLRIQAA
ncbi:MAG: DUF192 domain-containing protein [Bdellovibrionales bacterium]|nr:DUF192 domain-containing protein [Bdellovibrionales bacterium]